MAGYRWLYFVEQKLLVVAVGFGIGPQVAAENLLIDMNFVDGSDRFIWHDGALRAGTLGSGVRILLNFGVVSPLQEIKAEYRIWIDCVDWLRTKIPAHIQEYDLMLCESFFRSGGPAFRKYPNKWYDVRPIMRTTKRNGKEKRATTLLSFGGISAPYSTKTHMVEMPLTFLRGVASYTSDSGGQQVEAFVPDYLYEICLERGIANDRLVLRHLDRRDFHAEMALCDRLICQPGLYTPFEAMSTGVPFSLTYPMSFTQSKQLQEFRKLGVGFCDIPELEFSPESQETSSDIEELEAKWFADVEMRWHKISSRYIVSKVAEFIGTGGYRHLDGCSTDFSKHAGACDVINSYLGG